MDTISRKMARFVTNLSYDRLPGEVIQKAKCCMINGIAIGLSCHSVTFGRIAREAVKAEELGTPPEKGATIFCDGSRVTAMGAAFANAGLFHSRAQEDTLGSSHTGTVITPAVLALSERDGHPGKAALEAVIAGYEIVGPFDRVVSRFTTPRGFRASPVFGIFGSASAASRLIGLDEGQTAQALGFAAAFAGGTLECFAAGTMEWRFEVGVASREGMMAALISKGGAVSAPTAIEGKTGFLNAFANTTEGSELLARDLGKRWSIMSAGFKPYPVCAFNQTPVRTLLALMQEHNISYKDVKKGEIRVNPYEYNYAGMSSRGPFTSVGGTLMSTPFCVAMTLVDGKATLSGLERYEDPKIKDLMARIEHVPDEKVGTYSSAITIETQDGRTLRKESREGAEYYNFNMDQTVELAHRVTEETGVSREKVDKMIEFIQNIEKKKSIRDLTKLLGGCP